MPKEPTPRSESAQSKAPGIGETFGLNRYRFTPAKILLLLVAIAMMVIGGLGSSTATKTEPEPRQSPEPASGRSLVQPFVQSFPGPSPTAPPPRQTEERTLLEQWSPSLVRGGFSMFLGFAIGYAIRTFLRLASLIVGAYLLVLSMMAWAGWVEIHWEVMEGQFNHLVTNLEQQFASFKDFLMGSIPSAGLGITGLAAGLRQK